MDSLIYFKIAGSAYKLSTGISKKPCIWDACKSYKLAGLTKYGWNWKKTDLGGGKGKLGNSKHRRAEGRLRGVARKKLQRKGEFFLLICSD